MGRKSEKAKSKKKKADSRSVKSKIEVKENRSAGCDESKEIQKIKSGFFQGFGEALGGGLGALIFPVINGCLSGGGMLLFNSWGYQLILAIIMGIVIAKVYHPRKDRYKKVAFIAVFLFFTLTSIPMALKERKVGTSSENSEKMDTAAETAETGTEEMGTTETGMVETETAGTEMMETAAAETREKAEIMGNAETRVGDNNLETGSLEPVETGGEAAVESVASTEAPALSDKSFDETIESVPWITLVQIALNESAFGNEAGFNELIEEVKAYRDELEFEEAAAGGKEGSGSEIMENNKLIEEIANRPREKMWSEYVTLSQLHKENFRLSSKTIFAYKKGMAALDCLAQMGLVNGKEGKPKNEEIYNKVNLQIYGSRAIDGFFFAWKYGNYEDGKQTDADPRFYLGETFHHLGCAYEITSETLAIGDLLLAAVFYQMLISDNMNIYIEGRASEKQYTVCLNLAYVFDKLAYLSVGEDQFYLESAKRYYKYAGYCPTWSLGKLEKIDSYLRSVDKRLENE